MPTALQQVKSANTTSAASLAVTITSSLAGSVLWVFTAAGGTGITLSLPTDSALQTYSNLTPQVNGGTLCCARMDDMRNTASGVTSVTAHATASVELSATVQELTGTNNTLDGAVPVLTSTASGASLATNSISTATGSILAAGVTDSGGANGVYTVSPAAYTVDGLTPNGSNERIGSASAANVASGAHACTFTSTTVAYVAGQAAYAAAGGGGGGAAPPNRRRLLGVG